MLNNIKTRTLDAIEHELKTKWQDMHTAPQDKMQALYDLAMSAKQSADMYVLAGFPQIAQEYTIRARAYAREWRELAAAAEGRA